MSEGCDPIDWRAAMKDSMRLRREAEANVHPSARRRAMRNPKPHWRRHWSMQILVPLALLLAIAAFDQLTADLARGYAHTSEVAL